MKLRIDAMECGGCAGAVTAAVRAVDPAAEVAADLRTRTVELTTVAPRAAIEAALKTAGFPAAPTA